MAYTVFRMSFTFAHAARPGAGAVGLEFRRDGIGWLLNQEVAIFDRGSVFFLMVFNVDVGLFVAAR